MNALANMILLQYGNGCEDTYWSIGHFGVESNADRGLLYILKEVFLDKDDYFSDKPIGTMDTGYSLIEKNNFKNNLYNFLLENNLPTKYCEDYYIVEDLIEYSWVSFINQTWGETLKDIRIIIDGRNVSIDSLNLSLEDVKNYFREEFHWADWAENWEEDFYDRYWN